jgi:integrase
MDSFIGDMFIDEMHDGSFNEYRKARRFPTAPRPKRRKIKPLSNATLNRHIGVAARVLKDCATKWRDERSNLTWLVQAPWINTSEPHQKRQPYPLDWAEQRLFFSELVPHLQVIAEFGANSGARDQEICALEWAWEHRIPELDTPELRRSVFVIPADFAKNRTDNPKPRLLVLNDVAQRIVDSLRGQHPRFVFTYEDYRGHRDRLYTVLTTGWKAARRRAAARYMEELGREPPEGFRRLRVHDLRHTFGRRLRAAGVSLEDRQDLLGHEAGRVTTHYSAPEVGNLIQAANQVIKSRGSPERTVLRIVG